MNGYPLVWDNPGNDLYIYDSDWNYITNYHTDSMTLQEQNAYLIDYDINFPVTDVREIRVGTTSESLVIPINLDIYDYYLVGTVAALNTSPAQFGDIVNLNIHSYDTAGNLAYVTSMGSIGQTKFFNNAVGGRSFYAKINLSDVCNIGVLTIQTNGSTINGDIWFSASIVPVEKTAGTDAATAAIIQKLTEINTNQTNSNVLQQESNQIAQDTQNQIIQGNEIAQDQLEVEQEQAETTKSIFEKITDFFGSFFENLINAVIGLFVPGEEEMAEKSVIFSNMLLVVSACSCSTSN